MANERDFKVLGEGNRVEIPRSPEASKPRRLMSVWWLEVQGFLE